MTHPTPIRTAGYRTALPPRAGTCAFLLSAVLLSAVLIPACSGDIPGSDSAAVPVLELVEELRLGVLEGADEEMFAFVSDVLELENGSIVVLDSRAPALRHFSRSGEVLGTIGRSGEGPGEYTRPSGLALVPGEGFALWDAGNARISFFAPDGEFRSSVHVPLGLSSPLFRDAQGRFHIRSFVIPAGWQPSPGTASPPLGWIRLSREGAIQDTIPIPEEWPDGMGFIIQTPDGSLFPFQRRTLFALTPEGTPVHSTNESYRVVRGSPETPGETVIERRAHVPVPIEGEERAQYEAWARYVVRENPESRLAVIPPTKPAILELRVGDEGRFWVRPHRPGTRIPPPSTAPEPGGPPRIEFREIPPRYDLFSPEGAFLGEVEFPRGAQILRAAGNRVWVRTPGDVGEPQVVRYRVEARAGGEEPPRVASEPELSIGAVDGAAPIVFQQIRGAVRLSDGRIVVADGGSQEVRYFSASGSHVMTTGGPGDGPGEFRRLSGLTRLPGDSVWAHDGGALRFTILDPEGRVAAMGSTGTAPTVIGRMADGSPVYTVYARAEAAAATDGYLRPRMAVMRLAPDGQTTSTMAEIPGSEEFQVTDGGRVFTFAAPFPQPQIAVVSGNRLYTVTDDGQGIAVYGSSGRLERSIRGRSQPRRVTAAGVAEYRDAVLATYAVPSARSGLHERVLAEADYPEVMPLYRDLKVDADGYICAELYRVSDDAAPVWRVFNDLGAWVGDVSTPPGVQIFELGTDFLLGVHLMELSLWRMDIEGNVLDSLPREPLQEMGLLELRRGGRSLQPRRFAPRTSIAGAGTGYWVGRGDGYEIRRHGPGGTLERIVRWSGPDRTVPADLIREARQQAGEVWVDPDAIEFSETFPAYQGLFVDRTGNVWVDGYQGQDGTQVPSRWIVFDPDGRLIARATLLPHGGPRSFVREIGEDWVLGVTVDDLGVERVVRYRLQR